MNSGFFFFGRGQERLKFIYDLGLVVGRCDGASANASTSACRSGIRMNFVNHPLAKDKYSFDEGTQLIFDN